MIKQNIDLFTLILIIVLITHFNNLLCAEILTMYYSFVPHKKTDYNNMLNLSLL